MKTEKRYFLVQSSDEFYDGHGCPDSGATRFEVTSSKEYYDLDPTKIYNDDLEEIDEDEEHYEQDGYNCCVTTISFKEITAAEAVKFEKIIKDYEKLSV